MTICQKKNWSSDDWQALSEDAQNSELAWLEYKREQRTKLLDMLESKMRNDKGEIKAALVPAYVNILMAKTEI